jgi:hypothetical protein
MALKSRKENYENFIWIGTRRNNLSGPMCDVRHQKLFGTHFNLQL